MTEKEMITAEREKECFEKQLTRTMLMHLEGLSMAQARHILKKCEREPEYLVNVSIG